MEKYTLNGSTMMKLAQTIMSFCVLFLVISTSLIAQSSYVLNYASEQGTNNVDDYTLTAALPSSTDFTINSEGTSYGSEESFKTSAGSLTSTITFDDQGFGACIEISDTYAFSALGKSFNIYAGNFDGTPSANGSLWYDIAAGGCWQDYPTEFEDGGFVTAGYADGQSAQQWHDPEALIIKTTDGSEFKFTSFKAHDAEWNSWGNYLKITGYKNGALLASESVIIVSDVEPYHSTVTLTNAAFQDVDEVRITMDKDNNPDFNDPDIQNSNAEGLFHSFDTFVVDNAVSSASEPTVATSVVSSITATGATLSGNVTDDGGDAVTERGFVYGVNSTPSIGDGRSTRLQDGNGTGAFEEDITGLDSETTYYVRAYAINGEGTSYGSEESFTTTAVTGEKFDFESATATYTGWDTPILTVEDNSITPSFTITATSDNVFQGSNDKGWAYNGSEGLYFGWNSLETQVDFEIEAGNSFDLKGFYISYQGDGDTNPTDFTLSTDKGNITINPPLDGDGELTYIDVVGHGNAAFFQDISSFTLEAPGSGAYFEIDDIILDDFQVTNSAPTGITLNSTSVNQSDGANATIGSLSTTDDDGSDTHTYTLVTGTGDDDNASFNINGSDLRADDASALSAGDYSVRIQTNDGTDSYQESFTITVTDDVSPAVQSIVVSGSPGAADASVDFIISFNENVNSITTDDFEVTTVSGDATGSVSSVSASSGSSVTVTVNSISGDGEIRVDLKSSTDIQDDNGNSSPDAYTSGATHTVSTPDPVEVTSIERQTPSEENTNADEVIFRVTFNQDVTNVDASDFVLSGTAAGDGSISSVNAVSASIYDVIVNGVNSSEGTLNLDIKGNGGSSGSNDISSISEKIDIDNLVNPTNYVNNTEIGQSFTPTETGGLTKIEVMINSASSYDGDVTLELLSGDGFGGSVLASSTISVTTSNKGQHTITFPLSTPPSVTSGNIYTFKLTGSGDDFRYYLRIDLTNSTNPYAGGVLYYPNPHNGYDVIFATYMGSGNGAGLSSSAPATDESYTLDNTAPTVSITSDEEDPTDRSPIDITITFSEKVNDFVESDISTGNGTISNFSTDDNITFTADLTPDSDGDVTVGVSSSVATDNAGNQNTAALQFSIEYSTNTVPTAGNVTFSGTLQLGEELTGSYNYSDAENDTEDGTTYQWYRSDDADGGSRSAIASATTTSYTTTNDDIGKYISFEVTPHDGTSAGSAVESDFVGPVYTTPTLTNSAATSITDDEAGLEGEVTSDGSNTVTERGFVYSQSATPTVSDTKVQVGDGAGTFIETITGLLPNRTYYVRSYATNAAGTSYGDEINFTTGKKALTFSGDFTANDKVYDGQTDATVDTETLEITGAEGGDQVSLDSYELNFEQSDIGDNLTITLSDVTLTGTEAGNYTVSLTGAPDATASITAKELTIEGTFSIQAKTYDGNTKAVIDNNGLNLTGVVEEEVVSLDQFELNFSQADAADDLTVSISNPVLAGADIANYTITASGAPSLQANISKRTLTLSNFTADNKTYDGTTDVTGAGFDDDRVSDDELEFTYDVAFASADAETGATINYSNIAISGGADQDNYSLAATTGSITADIAQRELTITADGQTKVYGSDDPTLTYKITSGSLVDGESITGLLERTGDANVGNYTVNQGTLTAGSNYDLSYQSAAFSITPKTLTITADSDQTKIYGAADPTFTYSASGFELGDDETVITGSLGRDAGEDVGDYAITQGDLLAGSNYSIDFTSADFAITVKILSITANAGQSKVYGETEPTFTYSANGFENGDDEGVISGSLSRETGKAVGTYGITVGDLAAGDNYSIDYTGADFEITSRTLTLSNFTADNKTYDGTTDVTGAGFDDDRVSDDELEFTYDVAFASADAETGATINYSNIAISGGADQGNYTLASNMGSTTADITQRALAISANAKTKVYGANDPALTYTITSGSLVSGESFTGELQRDAGENVNTYSINQHTLTAGDNYSITFVGTDLTITPKTLTITADSDQSKIYGEADPVFTYSANGFELTDDETVITGSLGRDAGADVGDYAITQGDLAAGSNYNIDFTSADFAITPKTLSIAAKAGQSKVYGEADPTFTYSANGFENGDDVTIMTGALSRASGDDVDTYGITVGDLDAGDNYSIDYTAADFEITQRTLTLSNFTANNKTYDGTTDVAGDGFDDDRVSGDELEFTYDVAFASADAEAGATINYSNIAISGGADQGNYTLASNTGSTTANITQRALAISADAKTKVYGAADPALTYTITSGSLVSGESFTGALKRAAGETVGMYAIAQSDLTAGDNYSITYTAANMEITKKELVITVKAEQSKIYGQVDPVFTYSANGFAGGDDLTVITGALSRASGYAAGNYAINQGDLSAGGNYSITFNSAQFTITQKTLTVTTDEGLEKVYGGDDPVLTYAASGFVLKDDESIITGQLERELGEQVGTYPISQGNLSAGANYTIDFEGQILTIIPRALSLSNFSASNKVYDGTTDTEGSFEDDRITGDELSFDFQVEFEDENAGNNKQVNFSEISVGGTDGSNYQLESTSGEAIATITPRELIIEANSQDKEFGDDDPELTYQITSGSLVDGEELSGSPERESGEGVGTYVISQGSLTGSGNYTIDFTDAVFTIEGRGLLVEVEAGQQKTYGQSDPEFSYQVSGFAPGEDESILNGSISREEGENAGTYEITLGNLDAGDNYQLSIEDAEFTINPAELIVEADQGLTKFVGEVDPELTYQYSGFVFDDDESLFEGALLREEGEGFGNYEVILGTLNAGTNYSINFTGSEFRILRTSPVIANRSPEIDAPQAALDVAIYAEFDQDVIVADETKITLVDEAGQPVEFTIEPDGGRVELAHDGLSTVTLYTVEFEAGAIENLDGIANADMSWSFTTIIQIPDPVILSSPADSTGSVSFTQSLDFSWKEEDVAESYELQLSTDPEFTEPIYESGAIEGESVVYEEPLSPGQGYFWRVRAVNGAGSGSWSESGLFVTSLATPVLTFPEDDAEEISIAPNLQWEKGIEASISNIRFSSDSLFVEDVISVNTENSAYLIEGLEAEQFYYWEVQDTALINGVTTLSDWSSVNSFLTRPNPEETEDEPVTVNINFGSTSGSGNEEPGENPDEQTDPQQIDYRMVGLPGTDGIHLDEFFVGPYREAWRAFYETGADLDFYDEYTPDDPRFNFKPGLGFWVLSTEVVTGELMFTSVRTNESDAYGFPVHPGWNIIANPYQSSVEWSLVESFNEISSPLYGYAKAFVEVDTLKPFEGYYYYNYPAWGQDSLFIPYTGYDQRGTAKVVSNVPELLEQVPQIKLSLKHKDQVLNEVELIFSNPLKGSADTKIERLHPNIEQALSGMVVTDDEYSRLRYNRKLVPQAGLSSYHLEARTSVGRQYQWSLESLNHPDAEALLLVNKATRTSFMVTANKPARVKATEPISRYELHIGDEDELTELQSSMLPTEFSLSQNYPNPFNPSTNIRFSVPERGQVTLEIYDILGRKVQTLVNQAMQPGWHVVSWNASQLSSGMYLYRLQAGEQVFTKKLTLIK